MRGPGTRGWPRTLLVRSAWTKRSHGERLAASAREGRVAAVVVNVSSDAAISPYPRAGGARSEQSSRLRYFESGIWDAELAADGVRFLSLDPGDMDTPLHATAVPDARTRQAAQAAGDCRG